MHRFALSAIIEELLEREKEIERDSFGMIYTGYQLSIVKIKREREIKLKSIRPHCEVKRAN